MSKSSVNLQNYEKYSADDGRLIHDRFGNELPDDTPMAPPVGYVRQPSLHDQIRQALLAEKLRQAYEGDAETFEDADDFDVGDDFDPTSPYEADFDPMSDADKAALASQGRNVDAILGSPTPPKPPKKPRGAPVQGDPPVSDPAQPGGSEDPE